MARRPCGNTSAPARRRRPATTAPALRRHRPGTPPNRPGCGSRWWSGGIRSPRRETDHPWCSAARSAFYPAPFGSLGVARAPPSLAYRRCTRDAGLSRLRPQPPVAWLTPLYCRNRVPLDAVPIFVSACRPVAWAFEAQGTQGGCPPSPYGPGETVSQASQGSSGEDEIPWFAATRRRLGRLRHARQALVFESESNAKCGG